MSSIEPLPRATSAMWRTLKFGFIVEPKLLTICSVLAVFAALPDALYAVWLGLLGFGLVDGSDQYVWIGAIGMAASATLTWSLRVVSERTQRRFREKVAIALESHVAELQASIVSVELHERPEYLDRLAVLREQVFTLNHLYMSVFSTVGWILRLGVVIGILAVIHPALLLLIVFAIPSIGTSLWRPGLERTVEEQHASSNRLARHLFEVATTAPPGKEARLTGLTKTLQARRRSAWEEWYRPVSRARLGTGLYESLAWGVFGLGFVLAVLFAVYILEAPAAQTLVLIGAGSRLAGYVSATVGELGFLRGIWMDGSKRLAWLEDFAASQQTFKEQEVPDRVTRGITFKNVSFRYPGSESWALRHLNLELRSNSVTAIVGENGAGKTTLVKLLTRMYDPTEGEILLDGTDIRHFNAQKWRERLAGAFQDFFRFELRAKETIGLGDEPCMADDDAVRQAADRSGASDVLEDLRNGVQTQLGPTWPEGVEVSFGQWQKLSLARGFMRKQPLLLLLDEPTAALDAETEHSLFERYAQTIKSEAEHAAKSGNGRITILVSHRFSTVRMADQIVVLDAAELKESGSHADLMANKGQYASLYSTQAQAYR